MRKTNLRGGNDYKINEILGKNFKDFVGLLRGNDLSKFTFEALGDKSATTTGGQYKPNDLHYDFSQYVMAAAAAFREIEKPDTSRAEITGEYANDIYQMYDEIVDMETGESPSGGFASPAMYSLEFKALPYYKGKSVNINYLSSVFHLFPYGKQIFENFDEDAHGGLVNAIRYLYHFISLLDLDNTNVKEVMALLRGVTPPGPNGSLEFMGYVDQIVDTLSSSVYFTKESKLPSGDEPGKAIIRDAVINGLTAVAEEIIHELKNIPVNPGILPTKIDEVKTMDLTLPANMAQFPTQIGTILGKLGVPVGDVAAIRDSLVNIHNGGSINLFRVVQVNAKALVPDEGQRLAYAVNSYMNPYFFDAVFAKSIDAKVISGYQVQQGGVLPKKKKAVLRKVGAISKALAVNYTSLPFLYGPETSGLAAPADNGKRNLTTQMTQGDKPANANFVTQQLVDFIALFNEKVTTFGTPQDNGSRIILLSLVTFMIENGVVFGPILNTKRDELYNHIKKNVQAYNKFYTRIKNIPNDSSILTRHRDSFVSEFVKRTSRDYTIDPQTKKLVHIPPPAPGSLYQVPKGSNLDDPNDPAGIRKFYLEVVAADPKFYSEFFNLVRLGDVGALKGYAGDVNLDEAKSLSISDLSKYRLNVRKNIGYTRLYNLQTGGANDSLYGDIVFISLIPDYPTDNSVGGIWLSRTYKVPEQEIISRGTDVVRSIARIVYISPQTGIKIINVLGFDIDITDLARRIGTTGFFLKNYPGFLKRYLLNLASESSLASRTTWKEGELMISEHMLREGNTWQRQGDHFVKLDRNGKEIDNVPIEDNCAFIEDTRGCIDFLTQCLPAETETEYENFCEKLLHFNFKINVGMRILTDEVQKIDPQVAFAILRKFRFGSYLDEEKNNPPVKGFRRYKVQSVGSWLEELLTGLPKDKCIGKIIPSNAVFGCGPLRDQLGKKLTDEIIAIAQDPKRYNFLNYLDILVHWVNANPQVLNPEEIDGVTLKQFYPPICKSYRTYNYVDPYKPAELRLRGMSCGLDRLKSSIMNELSGANVSSTISTIASVPLGIEMPLSRYAFTNPIPFGGLTSMTGGHLYEIESELNKWNQAYGYELFDSIFRDLYSTMGNMVGKRGMRLSNTTSKSIEDKLERFKETEEALRKSLRNLIERNKIFQASRGHIDAFELNDSQLAAVLEKHSNLLAIGSAYNKKAVNLIDLFQTITKAILNKVDEGSSIKSDTQSSQSKYQRPLTMDFHYGQHGASTKKN